MVSCGGSESMTRELVFRCDLEERNVPESVWLVVG